MLVGSAFFFVPGVGPLLVAGPLVGWIVGVLEGAVVVGGMSVIGAGLFSLGIPKDSILRYETALRIGKFVVIVHGTAEETSRAREIIARTSAEDSIDHLLPTADLAIHEPRVARGDKSGRNRQLAANALEATASVG